MSQKTRTVAFDIECENCMGLAQFLLSHINTGDNIERVAVELDSSEPFELNGLGEVISDVSGNGETVTGDAVRCETETPSTDDEVVEEVVEDTKKQETFHTGGATWHVIKMMYERRNEGFFNITQIQQFTPNEHGIEDTSISQILWNLADRGHVEKKPHPDDGRKKVYKITGKGIDTVERLLEANNEE